jgi:predicted neutral ceramidase superfamily lipid hydrolase
MNFYNIHLLLILLCLILSILAGESRMKVTLALFFFTLLTVETVCYYFKIKNWNNLVIYNCWFPLEFAFYAGWVNSFLKNDRRKIIWFFIAAYLIITAVIYLTGVNLHDFNTITFQLGILLILPVLFFKLFELIHETVIMNPFKNPLFWLISGLLFSYLGSFFQFSLDNYLRASDPALLYALKIINIFLTNLLYICIILYFVILWLNRRSHT